MASPRTRRVLRELKFKDGNNVSIMIALILTVSAGSYILHLKSVHRTLSDCYRSTHTRNFPCLEKITLIQN